LLHRDARGTVSPVFRQFSGESFMYNLHIIAKVAQSLLAVAFAFGTVLVFQYGHYGHYMI